ncbi:aldo/keto reductase [Streptomyces minutiscleroticus]|uniref:aldo/keto reductase n=1 Tax=Streptomyces minutiscleroticus TaxID=68238 RepID=UPI00227D8217|nr:aldo/keto reductase [Streptomyces minutiscleroticus]
MARHDRRRTKSQVPSESGGLTRHRGTPGFHGLHGRRGTSDVGKRIVGRKRAATLTPPAAAGRPDVFALAASLDASVLINKPLAQGLLTGKYDPGHPPVFASGDHRLRKAWFTPGALKIIQDGLHPLRQRFGDTTAALTRLALQYCLQQADNDAVLVCFTRPEQITENLTSAGIPLTADELGFVRDILSRLQQRLDAHSEVFLDEKDGGR